jgi:hypothetical protein
LKNNQVQEGQNDNALKEQCELIAAHEILPFLRQRYPKLSFTFLGDSLYANQQFVSLCNKLKMDYVIVLKEGSQKNLNKSCDKLGQTEIYQKHHTCQETVQDGGKKMIRSAAWFNSAAMGEVFTNVLRFEESIAQDDGTLNALYKGAWICSKKISQNNCFKRAKQGRSRWYHEDFHNTLKRRGYDIKHDMARTDPNLLMVWKMMMFIAFFVIELFMHTATAQKLQNTRSCMKFAKDMLQQLLEKSWKVISNSAILTKPRVQFRFDFSP